jgi:pSer/pThr/pTyr-binding forkhead associated (FHA) protein
VLRRSGEGFELEDLGSENGTLVNGAPVKGTLAVAPGAEITIGKHVLSIRSGDDENLPAPRARKSDAWDAAQTYFAPELAGRAAPGAPAAAAPAASAAAEEEEVVAEALEEMGASAPEGFEPSSPASLEASAHDSPDPDGLFAFGEDELQLPPPAAAAEPSPELAAEFDVSAPEPAAPAAGSQTALFDFGATDDLGLSEPSLARVAAQKAAEAARPSTPVPAAAAPAAHAGLIVERSGKVERVVPFRSGELVVGRGATCDLVLATAGVSRRHARFVREGESFRVIDLGSANGLRVNGEPARERGLQVGDVVAIDDYTLTFVVDREPLDEAVRSPAAAAPSAGGHVTVLHDAPLAAMMEQDLVMAGEEDLPPLDGEKELEIVAEAGTAQPLAAASGPTGDWVVELVVAAEQLPPPLAAALRMLGRDELRLPAELRLRRR